MKNLYTAKATSMGGRAGHVETDDKRLSFDLTPAQSKTGTNPEQLFACGYAACFGSALAAVAKKHTVDASQASVTVEANLNQDDAGFFLSATIDVSIPGVDSATLERLIEDAHQMCPYSKATRGNIEVTLKANSRPLAKAAA